MLARLKIGYNSKILIWSDLFNTFTGEHLMVQDHNTVTPEKIARARENALAAFASRKPLEQLGFVPGRGPYEDCMADIYWNGMPKTDRTGTGTISRFGLQMRFDLQKGFPLITTKKLNLRSIIYELLWFVKGGTNNNELRKNGVTIWDEWAPEDGDLGPIYGEQWRRWKTYDQGSVDQLMQVLRILKTDPDSRRMLISAWNVADLPKMALMPCHAFFQFYVAGGRLSMQLYQRSADWFLGVPFNIASYALLTHMVAQQCDLEVGDFIWTGGDCHLYSNHFRQAELQLSREAYPLPKLRLQKAISIDDYQYEDFEIVDYQSHPHIPAPVAK